jgi:hypothetical protein
MKHRKGDIAVIPPDEARTYGDKVKMVDMKGSRYRVLVDIPEFIHEDVVDDSSEDADQE